MAGSLQPRVKTWVDLEDVEFDDLNAEFDNVLLAMQPLLIDDYSADVTQMQVTADPGEVGTESKATTLAGEIARLRKMVKEITGEDYWYESPVASLVGLSNAIGTSLTANRLVSGRVLTTSAQPAFLVPNGAARTVKLDGTPTNFIYYVDGTEYTISSDVTITSLTAAPSSNNTCQVNDANASAQYWTKFAGEDGSEIPIDTVGTEISALIGKFAAFKIGTEYFLAYVKSSTALTKARRGYFFDSTDAPLPRVTYSDNAVITLMKLTWVFAQTDGTLTATYNNPIWSDDEPTSPSLGDYWFDSSANTWKVYGIGSYSTANAILVGICIQDSTNTVAARSFEFFKNYSALNTIELVADTAAQVKSRFLGGQISVNGTVVKSDYNIHTWDMTLDLESGLTEASSTYYYFYLTETGDKVISDKKPHDRREDLYGYYHPSNSWRCVGRAFNNSSSDLTEIESYYKAQDRAVVKSVAAANIIINRDEVIVLSGASSDQTLPPAANNRGKMITLIHNGTSLTQVYTLKTYNSETIGGIASGSYALYTADELLQLISDGSNWQILQHRTETAWADFPSLAYGTLWTATGTAAAYGTVAIHKAQWKRTGSDILIYWDYRHTGAGTAGTGVLLFNLLSGVTIDTTARPANSGTTNVAASYDSRVGTFHGFSTSGLDFDGQVLVHSSTQLKIQLTGHSSASNGIGFFGGSGSYDFSSNAAMKLGFDARLPVSGWQP